MDKVACKVIDYTKTVKEERGMNKRIKKLRRQSIEAVERISVERAKLLTEFYKNSKETSIPIKRAKAFEYILLNKKITIYDGELIVGERGEEPKATPTYPEITLHKRKDLETLSSRPKVSYRVTDEVLKIYEKEIIPFWEGKTIREMIFKEVSQRWKDAFEAGVFTEFMEQRAPGHTVLDGKIYKKGMLDFIEEIDEQIGNLTLNMIERHLIKRKN